METKPTKPPWSPGLICLLSLFSTPIIGAVLHTLNYDRLGIKEQQSKALYTNLFLLTLLIFISINFGNIIFLFLLNIWICIYFYRSQIGPYEAHKKRDGDTASIVTPVIASAVIVLALYSLNSGIHYLENREENLAAAYLENKEYYKAKGFYLEQAKRGSTYSSAHLKLGIIYLNTERYKQAKNKFEYYLTLNPEDKEATELLFKAKEKLKLSA